MNNIATARVDKIVPEAAAAAEPAQELDRRYGRIGIPAVAAAARYQGPAKNAAYAPVATKWNGWTDEAA